MLLLLERFLEVSPRSEGLRLATVRKSSGHAVCYAMLCAMLCTCCVGGQCQLKFKLRTVMISEVKKRVMGCSVYAVFMTSSCS